MRRLILSLLLVAATADEVFADRQIKPFVGFTFGGATTLVDVGEGRDKKHLALGAGAVFLGEIFGVEADLGYMPGFFEGGTSLVVRSSVVTVTGSVIVALPRRATEYTLRPYAVGGFGYMGARTTDALRALKVSENLPAYTVGGGVTGFLTETFGVSWDVRYFRSIGEPETPGGTSLGTPKLSFWRANMALALRY